MLSLAQIRDIVVPILADRLSGFGYAAADVRLGEDHDGDPSIFIEIAFRDGHAPLPPRSTSLIGIECQDALRSAGDPRFAYLGFNVKTARLPELAST